MKLQPILTTLLLTLTLNLHAAENEQPATAEKPAADGGPAKTKDEDFSAYKTADDLWKRIEVVKAQAHQKGGARSQAEMLANRKEWLVGQRVAAVAFGQAYPQDERRGAALTASVEKLLAE